MSANIDYNKQYLQKVFEEIFNSNNSLEYINSHRDYLEVIHDYIETPTYIEDDLNITLTLPSGETFFIKDYKDLEKYIELSHNDILWEKYWKSKYLTLETIEDCSFRLDSPLLDDIDISVLISLDNGKTWINWINNYFNLGNGHNNITPIIKAGKRVLIDIQSNNSNNLSLDDIYGEEYDFIEISDYIGYEYNLENCTAESIINIKGSNKFNVMGYANIIYKFDHRAHSLQGMFSYSTQLISAKNLYLDPNAKPALAMYQSMFYLAISLKEAPRILNDTIYAAYFRNMFKCCISLEKPPIIKPLLYSEYYDYKYNNDKISPFCSMFDSCLSLKESPLIHIDICKNYFFAFMFHNCQSLIKANDIIIDKVISYNNDICQKSFYRMFSGCQSLKETPHISINQLINTYRCFESMFSLCMSLQKVHRLNIHSYQQNHNSLFKSMFYKCESLEEVPKDLFFNEYGNLKECIPDIYHFKEMFSNTFSNCINLKKSPSFNSYSYDVDAFQSTFKNCNKLEFIENSIIYNEIYYDPDSTYYNIGFYLSLLYDQYAYNVSTCNIILDPREQCAGWRLGGVSNYIISKNNNIKIIYPVIKDDSLKLYYDGEINTRKYQRQSYYLSYINNGQVHTNTSYWHNLVEFNLQNNQYDMNLTGTNYTWNSTYITLNSGYGPITNYIQPTSVQTSGVTLEIIVKLPVPTSMTSGENCIIYNAQSGGEGIVCNRNGTIRTISYSCYINDGWKGSGAYELQHDTSQWIHITCTRTVEINGNNKTNTLKLYINGSIKKQASFTSTGYYKLPSQSTRYSFGVNPQGTTRINLTGLKGMCIASYRYYERPLNKEEIKKNFEWEKKRLGFDFYD